MGFLTTIRRVQRFGIAVDANHQRIGQRGQPARGGKAG
jgi:hypothetical protein